jgi:carboxylesterase
MEPKHVEYRYKAESSDTVVVFVHGIQGSPLQFDFLVHGLNGLYSIENLLLPGHGQTVREFSRSGFTQWQNYVDERVKKLHKEYRNIILVGHSMGGLLSAWTAKFYPEYIRGLFLMSVPLKIHVRYSYITNGFTAVFSKNDKDEVIAAARRGNSITASNPFHYLAGVLLYYELLRKSKSTRAVLQELRLPIVLVHSADDEIVSGRSLQYVSEKQNIQVVIVNNAGHYHYSQEAKEQIIRTLVDFIAMNTRHSFSSSM